MLAWINVYLLPILLWSIIDFTGSQEVIKIKLKKGTYSGELQNETKIPHGIGTMWYKGKSRSLIYTGEWKDGMKSGFGKMTWLKNKEKDQDMYVGQFLYDEFHGKGVHYFANGDKYSGDWRDGEKSGFGTYTWKSGNKYTGYIVEDVSSGRGVFAYETGDIYTGDFVSGKRSGYGMLSYFSTDQIYIGYFKDDTQHGIGTLFDASVSGIRKYKKKINKRRRLV